MRYAALLRGTESAWQALSYGLNSVAVFGEIGGVYFNFALWAVAVLPAWTVIRHFGIDITQPAGTAGNGGLEATAALKDKPSFNDEAGLKQV